MIRRFSAMGIAAAQWFRQYRPRNLVTAQICIMWEACWSCLDDTAFLHQSKSWLETKCALSRRSLERHLPQLAKIELLREGYGGFRLPAFWVHHRQIADDSAKLSAKLAEVSPSYSPFPVLEGLLQEKTPLPPFQGGPTLIRKHRRRDRDRVPPLVFPNTKEFFTASCVCCPAPPPSHLQ